MSRPRVSAIVLPALLMTLVLVAPAAADHTQGCDWCGHGGPDGETPPPTAQPTPAPTQQPTQPPPPPPEPDPTAPPQQDDPAPAPRRTSSPTRTTTVAPTPAPDLSPQPTPLDLDLADPNATPEILVQGPVLDDGRGDEEQVLEARQAQSPDTSPGWAYFFVGFIIGGAIGWVGRGVRAMRRRKRQQLFG